MARWVQQTAWRPDPRTLSLQAVAAVLLGAALLGALYGAGVIETLGYERKRSTYGVPFGVNSSTSIGLHWLLLFEGQTYTVDYDVKVAKGRMRIGLYRMPSRQEYAKTNPRWAFTRDAAGQIAWTVPATGVYLAYFEPDGAIGSRDHDITYKVTWGAHF